MSFTRRAFRASPFFHRTLSRAIVRPIESLERRRLLAVFAMGDPSAGYNDPSAAHALDCIDTAGPIELDPDGHAHASSEKGRAYYDDHQSGAQEGSVGSTWGSGVQNLEYSYRNLTDGGLPGGLSAAQIRDIMEEAMLVWTAVAPLRLHEVSEGGSPDHFLDWFGPGGRLRFGHEFIDGASGLNVLAHAFQPNVGNAGLGGDLHFDDGNTWNYNDMLETGTHEVGHSFGLNHANGDVSGGVCPADVPAVMDACAGSFSYNGKDSGFLLSDDRNTMIAAYGGGFGYVLDGSNNIMVAGTELNNTITVSFSGLNMTVSSSGNGSWTRSWAGLSELIITPRGGNDVIQIDSLPPGMGVSINGGAGNDTIRIGGDNVALVQGNVSVNGGTGDDSIEVEDRSGAAKTFDFNFGSITNSGSGVTYTYNNTVEGVTFFGGGGSDRFNFNDARPELTFYGVNAGAGNDSLFVGTGDLDGVVDLDLSFNAGDGTLDRLFLNDSLDTLTDSYTFNSTSFVKSSFTAGSQVRWNSSLEQIYADANDSANTITVNAVQSGAYVQIDARDGNDTFNVGQSDYDNVILGELDLFGSAGSDGLNINDSGDTVADAYTLYSSFFAKASDNRTYYSTTESVNITANNSDNLFTIYSTQSGTAYNLNAGDGNDSWVVENGTVAVDILGAATLAGGLGVDSLTYNDTTTAAATYTLTSSSVLRSGSALVNFSSLAELVLNANVAASTIFVDSVSLATPVTVNAGDGNDTFIVGNGDFDNTINGDLLVRGDDGVDSLRIDDTLDTLNDTFELNNLNITKSSEANGIVRFGVSSIIVLSTVPEVEALDIRGSDANVTYDINGLGGSTFFLGIPPNPPTTVLHPVNLSISGGTGDDTVNIATGGTLTSMIGNITVNGGAGTDSIVVNDAADTSADTFTLAGSSLAASDWTFAATLSADALTLNAGTGDDTISSTAGGFWTYNGNAGADTFEIQSGINHTIHGQAGLDRIRMNQDAVSIARAFIDQDEDLQEVSIYVGGALTLTGAQVIDTREMGTIRGTIDLYKGIIVVRAQIPTYSTFAADKITRAYNGGAWNGTPAGGAAGVITSTAAFSSAIPDAVGFAHIGIGSGRLNVASVGGVPVSADDFVMRYTIAGDATLDRTVNFDDLLLQAQNYGLAGTWAQGDFTYSGSIDFDDLLLLAQQYGTTLLQGAALPGDARSRQERDDSVLADLSI